MKFSTKREVLLQPLSQVIGVVERRQTLPVLANFLIAARGKRLSVTGTDMGSGAYCFSEGRYFHRGRHHRPGKKAVRYCKNAA